MRKNIERKPRDSSKASRAKRAAAKRPAVSKASKKSDWDAILSDLTRPSFPQILLDLCAKLEDKIGDLQTDTAVLKQQVAELRREQDHLGNSLRCLGDSIRSLETQMGRLR